MDLSTGTVTKYQDLGDNFAFINAMGYNSLDNFIYGFRNTDHALVRLGSDGSTQDMGSDSASLSGANFLLGDIDQNGQLYSGEPANVTSGMLHWQQINLNPNNPTNYGKVVASGYGSGCRYDFADWAYVPGGGDYLYTLGVTSGGKSIPYQHNPPSKKKITI